MNTTKYIFINESGEITETSTCSDEDLDAVDAGILDIIRINPDFSLEEYYQNKWTKLTLNTLQE